MKQQKTVSINFKINWNISASCNCKKNMSYKIFFLLDIRLPSIDPSLARKNVWFFKYLFDINLTYPFVWVFHTVVLHSFIHSLIENMSYKIFFLLDIRLTSVNLSLARKKFNFFKCLVGVNLTYPFVRVFCTVVSHSFIYPLNQSTKIK
jgi:hypothetical protein